MKRCAVITAVLVGLLLALGGLGPAQAASTPTITVHPPGQLTPDQALAIIGRGCAKGSKVSVKVWNTGFDSTGGGLVRNSVATAGLVGEFAANVALDGRFPTGAQIAIAASCTATFDGARSSNVVYRWIQVPPDGDPGLTLEVPASVVHGQSFGVVAQTSGASGNVTVWLDRTTIIGPKPMTAVAWTEVHAPVAVGTHVVKATFTLYSDPSRAFTEVAAFRVLPRASSVRLTASKKAVKKGKKVTLAAKVSTTGSKTGKVRFKNGAKTLGTVTLRTADRGVVRIKVKLPAGLRTITATFSGNATVAPATSTAVKVQVGKKKAKKPKHGKKAKKAKNR